MRAKVGWIATKRIALLALVLNALLPIAGWAADAGHEDLAQQTQNPAGDLISLPFQNDTHFGIEPHDRSQNVLNIQPVIPLQISENWNIINRIVVQMLFPK